MPFYDLRPIPNPNPFDQDLNTTSSPTFLNQSLKGDLFFGNRTAQHIQIYGGAYGSGVQIDSYYFRSTKRFSWFTGGSHSDNETDPGGGILLGTWTFSEFRAYSKITAQRAGCNFEDPNNSQLELASLDGGPAFGSFHRGGFYGGHFGLDVDNCFSTRGFSAGIAPVGVWNYTSFKAGNIISLAGSQTFDRAYQAVGLYTSIGSSPGFPDIQVPVLKADSWTNSIHFAVNNVFCGYVHPGGFVSVSDFYLKDVIDDNLNFLDILQKINLLPVDLWAFKHSPTEHHIGTYAQAFHLAFQLNGSGDTEENPVKPNKTISALDLGGVCLAGIKGLLQKFQQQQQEIDTLKTAVKELANKKTKPS